MRSQLGFGFVLAAVAATLVSACSSSSSPNVAVDAGPTACSGATMADVFNNTAAACPVDANGNFVPYDQALTTTCDTLKQKDGDLRWGQCFDYLVFEDDLDSAGTSYTKCFYSVSDQTLVGVVFSDGKPDQCGGSSTTLQGGQVDPSCAVSGVSGGGGFSSCAPGAGDGGTSGSHDAAAGG
jgi:hypothetical protein